LHEGKIGSSPRKAGRLLKIEVPYTLMAAFLADPFFEGIGRGGEFRFESGMVLEDLLAAWPGLVKRIVKL
jgi:hypothetical protein